MRHDRAHVDDRALLEATDGLALEVRDVVVEAPPIDILAAVEVDHVEVALVEDPRDAIRDLIHQVGLELQWTRGGTSCRTSSR